jgi:hypothetical protein
LIFDCVSPLPSLLCSALSLSLSAISFGSGAYAVEATLLGIFLVDMLSSFFVARYDRGVLVGDRKTLIISYLRFR